VGLINTHEYSPLGPLIILSPLLWKLIPRLLHLSPSVVDVTFIFINTIYTIYILHYWACGRTSYLYYISLKWGLKTWMLHSPPTTNCTALNTQHHTCIHMKNLHHNTQYFYKFTTPTTIPTNNLSFPTTFTTQGSVLPSLHCIPSGCTTSLPALHHRSYKKSLRCGSRNFSCQNGVLCNYIECTLNFLQNFQKIVSYSPTWSPHAPILHLGDHSRSIEPLRGRWLYSRSL
jgi:hypothetical protein